MTILRKHLGEILQQDLEELCANAARETSELEFKGALPFQQTKGQSETADRWITRGDRIGEYARDKLLAELVAFANAEGGTLVLGIEETDDEPRRARSLAPLPRCEDLAKRLSDACEDAIEPRLPIVQALALPLADDSGAGFVILRVGRSAGGPHRLVSDGQFYIRRGERSVKMTVREIRDAVLELARRGDVIDDIFRGRHEGDRVAFSRAWAGRRSEEAHVNLLRVTALPVSKWSISNLTERRNLWWMGGEHECTLDGARLRVGYPARDFDNPPHLGLRTLHYSQDQKFDRSLTADGLIEARVVNVREPQQGRVLGAVAPLYLPWVVSLVCGVLAQVEHLRRSLADDGAEFGMQLAIDANKQLAPTWYEHGGAAREAEFRGVVFPILPVGPAAGFTDLVHVVIRDILNNCGSTFNSKVEIDWARLATGR
ncbi:ATP-binding protein [Mesorhizobium sp.]|uniref:AlbA family DNA-binding domain-containing protein n=1 Tax=Mesorhizobium sp. TaxID=1871066 RepID=UPI0025795A48|nr:ATP-binding protein [Mesorhizobium sp.]